MIGAFIGSALGGALGVASAEYVVTRYTSWRTDRRLTRATASLAERPLADWMRPPGDFAACTRDHVCAHDGQGPCNGMPRYLG
jgi:hypothetical protein